MTRLMLGFNPPDCIRSSYATKASAEEGLKKMLAKNPSGRYAVCSVAV